VKNAPQTKVCTLNYERNLMSVSEKRQENGAASWRDFWSSVRGYPLRAFFICLCGVSLENMDQAIFSFVLPQITKEFGWTVIERGQYLALTFTLAGLSIAGLGVLTDRRGRKFVFSSSMLIGSLFVALMYFARSAPVLLALRTVGFATGGIQSPVVGTITVEESPPRYRGLLSGIIQIGYPLGWFLASTAITLLITRFGADGWNAGAWRYAFFVSLLSIPYMVIIMLFLRETKAFQAAQADKSQARPGIRELFGPKYRFRTAMLFGGEFFHVFAYGSTILLNAYFQEFRGWTPAEAVKLVGLSYLVGSFGYILAAFVGEFFLKRRNVSIIWAWLGSLAFTALIWFTNGFWPTMVSYCLMTFFFYGATAVKFTFIAENFPTRLRATGVTFAGSLAVNLGIAFGPLALSYAVAKFNSNWNLAYTLCGILPIFVSGLFFLALPAEAQGVAEDAEIKKV
jgi:putative MFS transporter